MLHLGFSKDRFLSTPLAAGDQDCGPLWEDEQRLCHTHYKGKENTQFPVLCI